MCCVPNDEERKQFDLPHAMRVFNALKKHKFENWNGHFILTVFGDFYPALNGDFRPPLTPYRGDIMLGTIQTTTSISEPLYH